MSSTVGWVLVALNFLCGLLTGSLFSLSLAAVLSVTLFFTSDFL